MRFIAFLTWVIGLSGFAVLIAGIAMIHIPSAMIAAGTGMLGWAWLADKAVASHRARQPTHTP